jgi:thymidylate synthase
MNRLDKQYQQLLQDIIDYGVEKQDRTGTGTKSIFGYTIRHKMSDGFPLLTTKKMAWKTMVTELLWFLRGDTNIKFLVDNNCHIWTGDAYKNYLKNWAPPKVETDENPMSFMCVEFVNERALPQEEFINKIKTDDEFAKKWGELGPIYGKQWRKWEAYENGITLYPNGAMNEPQKTKFVRQIDQIQNLINDLKTNPDSRRLMVNTWNVGELDQMVLPPCHYGFQVYTRELSLKERVDYGTKRNMWRLGQTINYLHCDEKNIPTRAISLMWNQRSVDTFLGLPFNIASYGLLLMMLADEVNMVPDQLIGSLGDTHLYLNHIEQAKEQIGRDLTDEERYNKWFNNNYETGMERYFDVNNLPDFDDPYYEPTPKTTREPYPLPTVHVRDGIFCSSINDIILENYQSHPSIKAPLSN